MPSVNTNKLIPIMGPMHENAVGARRVKVKKPNSAERDQLVRYKKLYTRTLEDAGFSTEEIASDPFMKTLIERNRASWPIEIVLG